MLHEHKNRGNELPKHAYPYIWKRQGFQELGPTAQQSKRECTLSIIIYHLPKFDQYQHAETIS